ncbi:UNVERIFIED_CONTAM: hypothetical protein GTU68_060333, partial [Idotea baltica]|nr:hypothetical protein [Idotea baltica]
NSICIFIVEDEPSIAQTVQFTLEAEGFSTQHFSTGSCSIKALSRQKPSLILLDVGLSDGSGFDFFRKIRDLSEAPIIYMTARGDEIDRVVGLEMGADDYIVKPFSLRELVARVRAVLRRSDHQAANVEQAGHDIFSIDTERKKIYYQKKPLDLTLHEYRLLEVLLNSPEKVFTRSQLLAHSWDAPDHRLERTIDSHIKSLRNKLRQVNPNTSPICTHRGMGYSLVLDS